MMLIGYARVSTEDQKLRLQHDALTDGGCEKLFREKLSGTSTTLRRERSSSRSRARAMSSWCGNSTASGAPSAILLVW